MVEVDMIMMVKLILTVTPQSGAVHKIHPTHTRTT